MFKLSDQLSFITSVDGRKLTKYSRDMAKEKALISQIQKEYNFHQIKRFSTEYSFPSETNGDYVIASSDKELDEQDSEKLWIQFVTEYVEKLRARGWKISLDKTFPYNVIKPDDQWYSKIEESSGVDWFSFELGVNINGKQTNLLPILLQALNDENHAVNQEIKEIDDNTEWYFTSGHFG